MYRTQIHQYVIDDLRVTKIDCNEVHNKTTETSPAEALFDKLNARKVVIEGQVDNDNDLPWVTTWLVTTITKEP